MGALVLAAGFGRMRPKRDFRQDHRAAPSVEVKDGMFSAEVSRLSAGWKCHPISRRQDNRHEGEPFECPMKPFGGAETFAWSPDSKARMRTRKLRRKEYAFSTDSNLYLYDLCFGA